MHGNGLDLRADRAGAGEELVNRTLLRHDGGDIS